MQRQLRKNKMLRKKSKGEMAIFVCIVVFAMFISIYPIISSLNRRMSYFDCYSEYLLEENIDQKDKELLMTKLSLRIADELCDITDVSEVSNYYRDRNITVLASLEDGTSIEYERQRPGFLLKLKGDTFLLEPCIRNDKIIFRCGERYEADKI